MKDAGARPLAGWVGPLWALGGFALFSLHDALVKTLAGYSAFQIVFFAVLFSYVPFTFTLAADRSATNLRPVNPGWIALRSACMSAGVVLAFTAFSLLELTQAYALLFSTPVVITVLAIPMLGERVRLFRWVAITIGFIGVLIALGPARTNLGLGHLAALGAVACSAVSAVTTRRIAGNERTATLIVYPLLANVVGTGCVLAFVYEPMPFVDLARMGAIGGLSMLAQYCIISAYRSAPASHVAPCQYSQFLWAIAYGYLWFDELPRPSVLLGGGVIIFAGLLIVAREASSGVSRNRPFLRTRNTRPGSAPAMPPAEGDADGSD